jgi:hypothetical protein
MIQEFSAYPDWKAPAEDSAMVIWPEPGRILSDTLENHQRLSAWDSPLGELRRRQREMLRLSEDRPVIASGHQTELFHPGVWAKLAMLDAVARPLDADCLFAAVDTDAPKHLQFRWPGHSMPITDDPRLAGAEWCGLLEGPSTEHIERIRNAFRATAGRWPFPSMAGDFLDDLAEQTSRKSTLSADLTSAMYRLDWNLGLRHQSIVVSGLWSNEPYLAFVCHLLGNADSFAEAYNRALDEYRLAHGIDNPGRPMPDLCWKEGKCEVPFWLDDLAGQKRSRACVQEDGQDWRLNAGGDSIAFSSEYDSAAAGRLHEFLQRHNLRLSPRALTLTMFLRLMVVDQFVHGIGGGRYEQVNDRVIHAFFGIEPPAFSVTTATLYFPAAVGRQRVCLPCLAHEGHRLRHAVMGDDKMQLVRQIAEAPRRSMQRQQIFSQMHSRRATAVQIDPGVHGWQQRLAEAVRRNADEQGMFDRELFYGIQPKNRLEGLIQRYQQQFV